MTSKALGRRLTGRMCIAIVLQANYVGSKLFFVRFVLEPQAVLGCACISDCLQLPQNSQGLLGYGNF